MPYHGLPLPPDRLVFGGPEDLVVVQEATLADIAQMGEVIKQEREWLDEFRGDLVMGFDPSATTPRQRLPGGVTNFRFGIWDQEELVGGLTISDEGDRTEIDNWLRASHAGRGIGTRALKLVLQGTTEQLGIERLQASVEIGNIASARSYQKAGFRLRWILKGPDGVAYNWEFEYRKEWPPELDKPPLSVRPVFENDQGSTVEIEVNGMGPRNINHGSTTHYRVKDGTVWFIMDGELHRRDRYQSITAPRGKLYQSMGIAAVMEAVSMPPFDPGKVETF